MLGKALEKSTDNHDEGAEQDGQSSTVVVGDPGSDRDGEDGTELVRRIDESKQTGLNGRVAILIDTTVTKV